MLNNLYRLGILVFALTIFFSAFSQEPSENNLDSFLLKRKGLLGKLARSIMTDQNVSENSPQRNDLLFKRYSGKIIRNIKIRRPHFGIPITDTSQQLKNQLIEWANDLHHTTREQVIRNNLFFKEGQRLNPEILSDNERHLRDLRFIQDAKISVMKVDKDSVDVLIITKDVLSLGGSFKINNTQRAGFSAYESNLAGWGHEILFRTLFDNSRSPKMGVGSAYTARNIKGSFVDWYGGFTSFGKNFNTENYNETNVYSGFVRPLVNPYMKFTYALEASVHTTHNQYKKDSLYTSDHQYRFFNYDSWIGWNTGALKAFSKNRDNRMRVLLATRYLQQNFTTVPSKYLTQFNYLYSDVQAALLAVTIFRQDFYKSKFVYGFGTNEDIPEGLDITVTGGWTKKWNMERPYIGVDLRRYYFTEGASYFSYTIKAEGYLRQKQFEDINLLLNLNYFSRFLKMGKWGDRIFVDAGITHQAKRILNEALFLQSDFGLKEWHGDTLNQGVTRTILKAESVLFTPLNIANFKSAIFLFTHTGLFSPQEKKIFLKEWYQTFGGGLRIRNESLVFQTIEFRATYFPQKDFFGKTWKLELNTNIRFKYNQQFIKRPGFISVNWM